MKLEVSLRRLGAYKLILAFAVIVVLVMFTPAAKLLIPLYPCGCLYVGLKTIKKSSAAFMEFVTWVLFLTPLIRRVVDYEINAREMVIISTPFLVLLIPALVVVGKWRSIANRHSAPLLYAMAAVVYGAFIACTRAAFSSAAIALLMWTTPICFALYLILMRGRAKDIYSGFERAMLGGTFVAGAYGLIQYFILPPWDAAWMRSVDMVTIGKPAPMEVRVFSTLNSPQILAGFLLVGILLTFRTRSRWKYAILLVGVGSLALSFARSAWVGIVAGWLFLGLFSSSRERIRSIAAAIGCGLLVLAAFKVPQLSDTLSTRFETFTDLQHDESAADRRETFDKVIQSLKDSPTGIGLGVDNGMADAENDSSIVAVLLSLGIPGALVYAVALSICALTLFSTHGPREHPQLLSLQCCFVGLIVESPLNDVTNGQIAFLLWSLIGIGYGIRLTRSLEISHEIESAVVV